MHTVVATRLLEERGFPAYFTRAVRSHNETAVGSERSMPVDYALTAAESVTGLIAAAALVRPEKENRLHFVKVFSLKKRMKEKAFARNVNRDSVRESEKLGFTLEDFLELSLAAMREISRDLGL